MFFGRLLDTRGMDVCSMPHIQGLMHWFSCVPDMDFQYVLQVIENGNPCKYWAPKGQDCPTLSPECEGRHCSASAGTGVPPRGAAETVGPRDLSPQPRPAHAKVGPPNLS